MTLPKLLFELSGRTRLEMLHALETNAMTFTEIADQMEITSSEASRQIERLSGMDLIEKLASGSYAITPLGRLMLSFLPGIGFLCENSDYFLSHDTAGIPHELVMRFGDLSGARFTSGLIETLNLTQERMRNAKEYHCVMTDGVLCLMIPPIIEKIESGVTLRMIFPKMYWERFYPVAGEYGMTDEHLRAIGIRTLPSVPVCVGVTDSGCAFKLPDFDGEIDHSAMVVGNTPAFCRWCRDLYAYYWERASPV